jgi:hypothetical protein
MNVNKINYIMMTKTITRLFISKDKPLEINAINFLCHFITIGDIRGLGYMVNSNV